MPKSLFKNIWDIPDYIASGKRRSQPIEVEDDQFSLIERCWRQKTTERLAIGDIVNELQQLYKKSSSESKK